MQNQQIASLKTALDFFYGLPPTMKQCRVEPAGLPEMHSLGRSSQASFGANI
jgi:hypothetical protein